MTDFDALARHRQEESLIRRQAAQDARQIKINDDLRRQGEAIEYLSKHLIPVLEEAKAALESTDVFSNITRSWIDGDKATPPFVTFYCGQRGVRGGIDLPIGEVAKFSAGGNILKIEGLPGFREQISCPDERSAIMTQVDRSLTSYYKAVERS